MNWFKNIGIKEHSFSGNDDCDFVHYFVYISLPSYIWHVPNHKHAAKVIKIDTSLYLQTYMINKKLTENYENKRNASYEI